MCIASQSADTRFGRITNLCVCLCVQKSLKQQTMVPLENTPTAYVEDEGNLIDMTKIPYGIRLEHYAFLDKTCRS